MALRFTEEAITSDLVDGAKGLLQHHKGKYDSLVKAFEEDPSRQFTKVIDEIQNQYINAKSKLKQKQFEVEGYMMSGDAQMVNTASQNIKKVVKCPWKM